MKEKMKEETEEKMVETTEEKIATLRVLFEEILEDSRNLTEGFEQDRYLAHLVEQLSDLKGILVIHTLSRNTAKRIKEFLNEGIITEQEISIVLGNFSECMTRDLLNGHCTLSAQGLYLANHFLDEKGKEK